MRASAGLRLPAVLFALLLLANCGGGGSAAIDGNASAGNDTGGNVTIENPPPPPVDPPDLTPPPVIASTSPAPGSGAVDSGAVIIVTFTRAMSGASIDSSSFTLEDALGNPVAGSVSYRDNVAVFTPSSLLVPGTGYVASIGPGIRDADGAPIDNNGPSSWTFTVRARMEDPFLIASYGSEGGQIFGFSSATGENGDLFVVWKRYAPGSVPVGACDIHARRRPAGGEWEAPVRLGEASASGEEIPAVVVDRKGNALIAWSDFGRGALLYVRYSAAGGWEPCLSVPGGGPGLKMTGNGNGDAIVCTSRQASSAIYAQLWSPATGWGSPVKLDTGTGWTADHPDASMDPAGNVMVVWQEASSLSTSDYTYHIKGRRFTVGRGWGAVAQLDTTTIARYPQVGTDDQGNALCVFSASYWDLWSARYDAATDSWGTSRNIHPAGSYQEARYPGIAVGPSGNAIAGFREQFMGYAPATGWGAIGIFPGGPTTSDPFPLKIDQFGNATAAWNGYDGQYLHLWTVSYSPGSGWGAPVEAGVPEFSDVAFPKLSMNRRGQTSLVWKQGSGDLWSRKLR